MQLQQASRKKAKIKLGIQGPSGSGKTYSSLLLAYGLTGDWNKCAIVDTENRSADLYAHLGNYQVLGLEAPFSPERYIEAIRVCLRSGIEVVIIDSVSHEWFSTGGILDMHGNMTGNSYTNWSRLTPRHNAFVQEILQAPIHIIASIRTKQDYVLVEKNGRQVPEKVGLTGITRAGFDYDLTLVFELDIKHNAIATKDRTSLFIDKPEFTISTQTGKELLDWCNLEKQIPIDQRINNCKSIAELLQLYHSNASLQEMHKELFSTKRQELNALHQENNNHLK